MRVFVFQMKEIVDQFHMECNIAVKHMRMLHAKKAILLAKIYASCDIFNYHECTDLVNQLCIN